MRDRHDAWAAYERFNSHHCPQALLVLIADHATTHC